ncbi:ectoine synthase [Methanobacterium ferruginis]|jgi:L-ectoine synthase|uniref:ectoine synthase n=1 Tax=Methanobacterium ferruginis TaxID=710191 RepID=UPI0025727339|nr:ectoine synthase [Methanobacterium ferruginis]MCC7550615.1 ectoine synthase [Methanobacterium sp.]BDZ67062.1 L-ectoine synthase [Methanobacterium ferruginis]
MIVRTLEEIEGSSREVFAENNNWVSKRFLIEEDDMGFSFNETIIYANTETLIWYKNHVEAVYCVEGEGEIETTNDGTVYPIKPGTMYALDKHDRHYLRAYKKDLRLLCVFNPALVGTEIHDKDGSYVKVNPQSVVEK